MAHFQLYLPGRRYLAPNDGLADVGLDGLFCPGDRRPTVHVGQGPDAGRGLFLVWRPNRSPGYWPNRQTWCCAKSNERRRLRAGRFWCGFDDHSPPTPADLKRDASAFEDGRWATAGLFEWNVPRMERIFFLARNAAERPAAGRTVDAVGAIVAASQLGDDEALFAASMDLALNLLSFNYRMMGGVANSLALLEPPAVAAILTAAGSAPADLE